MKFYIFFFILLFIYVKGLSRPNLIPYPHTISFENSSKTIDPCQIEFKFPSQNNVPYYYYDILQFFYRSTFPERHCSYESRQNVYMPRGPNSKILQIKIENYEDSKPNYPTKTTNESYKLDLTDANWLLQANNYVGFLRGIETFFQLLDPIANSSKYRITFYPIHINDTPSLSYRGVLIDTARHFIDIATLKHVLDGLLFHKLNVFHWHITDEESFPLELDSYPNLTKYGVYSANEIYTKDDVEEIVEYARYRGIRVIPEIDSPAHSLSWGFSEELKDIAMKCFLWANYNGQLDPTLNKTYEVVQGILNDVDKLFPDEYVHLGGDEVGFKCWEDTPHIKAFMQANGLESGIKLQNYYKQREEKLLNPNKTAIFWINDANFDYREQDILQYWGSDTQYNLIKNYTNKIIWSNYDYFYIDLGYGNLFGGDSWAPFVTWKKIYSFNPFPVEIEKSRVLGGEIPLWAELNSEATTDNHLWSRGSAFAERFWNTEINNGNQDIVARLYGNELRLIRRGFDASPVTSQYCSLHVDVCFP